jgi:hypothetical protein
MTKDDTIKENVICLSYEMHETIYKWPITPKQTKDPHKWGSNFLYLMLLIICHQLFGYLLF